MPVVKIRKYACVAEKQAIQATKLGQVASIDQMISTQLGFAAQLKGKITNQWYKTATVCVDHFSGLH